MDKVYPDISAILAAKEERRRALAALSWEQKVAIIELMRRLQPKNMWKRPETPDNGVSSETDKIGRTS